MVKIAMTAIIFILIAVFVVLKLGLLLSLLVYGEIEGYVLKRKYLREAAELEAYVFRKKCLGNDKDQKTYLLDFDKVSLNLKETLEEKVKNGCV